MTPLSDLSAEIDQAQQETDPATRVQKLRKLRTDIAFLVGVADRYIGDAELEREGSTMGDVQDDVSARADADARDLLVSGGALAPEAADRAGIPDHDQLDQKGTLTEAWMLENWSAAARARHLEIREALGRVDAANDDRDLDEGDDPDLDAWVERFGGDDEDASVEQVEDEIEGNGPLEQEATNG